MTSSLLELLVAAKNVRINLTNSAQFSSSLFSIISTLYYNGESYLLISSISPILPTISSIPTVIVNMDRNFFLLVWFKQRSK